MQFFFRIGKLHFGWHGFWGISSLVFTTTSIIVYKNFDNGDNQQQQQPFVPFLVLWISQLVNTILSIHAQRLLPQVPHSTRIMPHVVAPHKEAFIRTIRCMWYLVLRVVGLELGRYNEILLLGGQLTTTAVRFVHRVLLGGFWYLLVPRRQFQNGNTWIFVVPIFVGVTGDLLFLQELLQVHHLLQIQLTGSVLAFCFTLAFRHYIPMWTVYAGAALAVLNIVRQGIQLIQSSE